MTRDDGERSAGSDALRRAGVVAAGLLALVGLLGTEEYAHLGPHEAWRGRVPTGAATALLVVAAALWWARRATRVRLALALAAVYGLALPLHPWTLGRTGPALVAGTLALGGLVGLAREARARRGLGAARCVLFVAHAAFTALSILGVVVLVVLRADDAPLALAALGVGLALAIDASLLGRAAPRPLPLALAVALWFVVSGLFVAGRVGGAREARAESGATLGPYLQGLRNDGVTVCWSTGRSSDDVLLLDGVERARSSGKWHAVRLEGLEPDREYRYTVRRATGDAGLERGGRFRTAPGRPVPFEFAVLSDTGASSDWGRCVTTNRAPDVARSLREHSPAARFLVHCGDFTHRGDEPARWRREFFEPLGALLAERVLWPALGNHELDGAAWLDTFDLPNGERYYAFDYAGAHFVVLAVEGYAAGHTYGPEEATPLEPGSAQHTWLAADLAAHAQGPWTFVFFHHPALSSGLDGGYRPALEHLVPLFERHGVDVVFGGHDHGYELSVKDGIAHVVTGGGGSWLSGVRPMAHTNPYSRYARSTWHHCRVSVEPERVTVRAIDTRGVVFHGFSVARTEGADRVRELTAVERAARSAD